MNAKEMIFFCDTLWYFVNWLLALFNKSFLNLLEREDMRLFDLKWFYNHYLITAIYASKVFKKNSLGLEKQS